MVEIDVILNTGEAKRLALTPDLIECIETDDFDGVDVTVITMASGKEYRIADPPFAALRRALEPLYGRRSSANMDPRMGHQSTDDAAGGAY